MTIEQLADELRDEIAQLKQQEINLIAEANRQIGQVQGAIATKQALFAKLTEPAQPATPIAPAQPAKTEADDGQRKSE